MKDRKQRVRFKTKSVSKRNRLSVFRSNNHLYAQIIDDEQGHTLVSASSAELGAKENTTVEVAREVGKKLAEMATANGISSVVFDRNGYVYHGKVKALADGAREGGLKF